MAGFSVIVKAVLSLVFFVMFLSQAAMAISRTVQQSGNDLFKMPVFQQQVHSAKAIYSQNKVNTGSTNDQHPADISVFGDPLKDSDISIKIQTPIQTYNLNLERLNNTLLHKDFTVLNVFTDPTGKTVFHEDSVKHKLHDKSKELNFYHDPLSGTLVSVRANHKPSTDNLKHFVEGIIHDDVIIAPPVAHKRHKRSLHQHTHTMWRKAPEIHNFIDDELFVPPNIDKLKFPTTITPLGPTSYDNVPYTHVNRTKRQVTLTSSKIEPELLLFCDNAMVQQFEGDTDELLEYLLHFWHAVNWKFLTISLQRQWPHIDLKIREIGVFRDPSAQPFIEENRIRRGSRLFSLYDAMDSLQRWLVKYETVLPLHDAAFLQTGNDACRMTSHTRRFKDSRFTSDEDEEEIDGCVAGTAGVAYVRGSCLSAPYFRKLAYNFGIGEASTSFNGVIIAAHEVGHLLGAYHDGEAEARGCASNSGYIMSYSREDAYKFSRFSPCSISSFQNFLNMDRSACLRQRASNEIMKFPTSFPGTYMSINEQCRRFTGGPPCEIGPKQCEHLCCDDAKGQWRYTRSEPAVDGTSCGKRNVCLNGQCISLASFG
ncbi:A disintegrin and metalloproteinase with thrombospondin motifs like [Ruditapes philippinarum]|uniref:A disintegrin and metalloproteinase with thrombospondin motifs like n=1 Tax=Ruditapes philippinarum TaxID=129788 RepID=UPI00295AB58D|nr:A disintegrin and metalloproteinase with thrombospondin motifs like [Ruditapes philippinarum]